MEFPAVREGITMASPAFGTSFPSDDEDNYVQPRRVRASRSAAALARTEFLIARNDDAPLLHFMRYGHPGLDAANYASGGPSLGGMPNLPRPGKGFSSGRDAHQFAAVKASMHHHGEAKQKRRRNDEADQHRRIRAANFEPQSVRGLDGEIFSAFRGLQARKQEGILGGGPASQLWERGILSAGPSPQSREHGRLAAAAPLQLREQGRLISGPAPQLRDQGILAAGPGQQFLERGLFDGSPAQLFSERGAFEGRGPALQFKERGIYNGVAAGPLREHGILVGGHASQSREQGLLGRWPASAYTGSERMLVAQAHNRGRNVDQEYISVVGSQSLEHGILGGGPASQLGEHGRLGVELGSRFWEHGMQRGSAPEFREQGLLGRGPSPAATSSERLLTFQAQNNGRYVYQEQYGGIRAPAQGLLGRMPASALV